MFSITHNKLNKETLTLVVFEGYTVISIDRGSNKEYYKFQPVDRSFSTKLSENGKSFNFRNKGFSIFAFTSLSKGYEEFIVEIKDHRFNYQGNIIFQGNFKTDEITLLLLKKKIDSIEFTRKLNETFIVYNNKI